MEIKNDFTGGMVQDSIDRLSNPDTYFLARNAIHESRHHSNFGLVNEESDSLFAAFGNTIVGKSHIAERNQTLFFVDSGDSELWLMNHGDGRLIFVCSDAEFGCDWGFGNCEFLYGEFKAFNACQELHVYWSSDCIYHVVNIDELLDPVRKNAVITCEDCSYFDVFKATCGPHLSALPAINSGSTLEAGSVQFAVQFKDNDGNVSNVFDISETVKIESSDNISGQPAKMSAKLRIDGLDKAWNDVIIYVIHKVGQITHIKKMPSRSYGDKGFTFEYYGQDGENTDVAVLINKAKAYLRGQDLIQKDGRLFYYNIKNERNLNYQKYANQIQVEWVEYEVSMEQQQKYHFPSLMRGEVYAIGIVWKFLDGTYSPVYHIPCSGGAGATSILQEVPATDENGDYASVLTVDPERSPGNQLATELWTGQYCVDGAGNCVQCNYCEECNSCEPTGRGKSGGTASGGASSDGSASDGYNPIMPENFDVEEEFERKRNPSEVKDRPNESDELEENTRRDVNNIDTQENDYTDMCAGFACVEECRCCPCDQRVLNECCEDGSGEVFQDPTHVAGNTAGDWGSPTNQGYQTSGGDSGCGEGGEDTSSEGDNGWVSSTLEDDPHTMSSHEHVHNPTNQDICSGSGCGGGGCSDGTGGSGSGSGGAGSPEGNWSTSGIGSSSFNGDITFTFNNNSGCSLCYLWQPLVDDLPNKFPNADVTVNTVTTEPNEVNGIFSWEGSSNEGTIEGEKHVGFYVWDDILAEIDQQLADIQEEEETSDPGCDGDAADCDCGGTQTECVGRIEGRSGCDCGPLPRASATDIMDLSNVEQNNAELMSLYGRDYPDPPLDRTATLKAGAVDLIDNAVIEREYITQKRPVLTYSGSNQEGPGKSPETPKPTLEEGESKFTQKGVGTSNLQEIKGSAGGSIRGDNWVDSAGNPVTEEPPRVVGSGSTTPYISTVHYPDDKDCDGRHFYAQGPICHHQIPWTSERPHFVSFQNGVINKYQPHNYEFGKTYVRPIGFRLSNIKFPDDDELPKPLCSKSPYKIVYVQRTDQNKSVFAKGWLKGIFTGNIYGENYAYPRHGVNSFESVDRYIAPEGDPLSRFGSQSSIPIYTFHSPDTDCDNSFLPVNKCKSELALRGSGWRHGLYAEGKKPETSQWEGTRTDNRGARLSNNLNHYTAGGAEVDILGLSYAPGNTIVTPPSGVSLPLMNKARPSSVYMELSGNMAGDDQDQSFVGDVRTHFAPTMCNAPYVALVRDLPDQYGSVEGLKYIDLGLVATQAHANASAAIEGLCGDVWIGPYAKKDTSYVSNKHGDIFNPPQKPGSPCRPRSWCDSPDDKIFQYFGIDHYPTKYPRSGDRWDPKNYAGLHTIGGECGDLGYSKSPAEAAAAAVSETDFYWPGVCKSLNMTVVESHVNPWLRETGEGSQLQDGKVWYPKLKDLYLDADAPHKHPWEESYIPRFYRKDEQPSIKQLWMKTAIRTMLNLGAPAGLLTQFQEVGGLINGVSTFMIFPMLAAFWILATNTLFTDRRLNQMLRIGDCRRDEEGGDLDENVENWEDNYCRYNWDYSEPNAIQPYYAFPLPFNTCDCDSCSKTETNNQIYHSNKQNLDSELDAYRNVRLNNYSELPAHAGKIQKMFIQGNGFYIHTTDGIWLAKLGRETLSDGIAFQQAGSGELLTEPQLLFEGVVEGFAGTQHPNAAINTAFGYFFIDDIAKKIYRFNGSPEEISAYGMHNFFKENLGFCQPKTCYDEKTPTGIHYSLGWDPRHNRLLVTKRDGSSCNSFTASYTPLGVATQGGGSRGKWISFHDYIPDDYLWDRNKLFSIDYGSGNIYKHHDKGSYTTYRGTPYPFEIMFSSVSGNLEAFDFEYLLLDTDAEIGTDQRFPIRGLDETFNEVFVWNTTQGTGTITIAPINRRNNQSKLITSDYSKVRFFKERNQWRANAIKDLVLDDCRNDHFLLNECGCQVIPVINEALFDCEKMKTQDMKNRTLSDKHLNFWYKLNNRNDMRLYVIRHKVYDDQKEIPKQG